MILVNMLTEQASHPGLPEVPKARLQAPGPVLMERTQGGYQAQRSLGTSKLMIKLTVTMTTNLQGPRCGALIVRTIYW